MTFFFIPWRPVISRFAQNAAHHLCSSVFKASVGCPIFPRLDAQTVDARKPLPTTTTGHLRIAKKGAAFIGRGRPRGVSAFYDNLHFANGDANNPIGGQPPRFSLWEIHPITSLKVCKKNTASQCDPNRASDWRAF
jgi:hypothetical protein